MCDLPRFEAQLEALDDLGYRLPANARMLDFGCRGDRAIQDCLARGYDAFGCDLSLPDDPQAQALVREGRLRAIEQSPYRLPFDDDTFDFVFSNQVFEHVQNYTEALAEIARVMKPGAVGLHVFPSRYCPIEPHVKVPLATVIRAKWWLSLWTTLGVRNAFERGLSASEAADRYRAYLEEKTNYLPTRRLTREFAAHFSTVRSCFTSYLKHYPAASARVLHKVVSVVPLLGPVLETFSTRVVLLVK